MKFGLFNSIAEKTTHWNVVEIKLLFFIVEFHARLGVLFYQLCWLVFRKIDTHQYYITHLSQITVHIIMYGPTPKIYHSTFW